jgi:hypothetical protein
MNLKKVLIYAIITIAAFLLLGIFGLFIWSQTGTYPARSVALAALESTAEVTVSQDKYIIFSPIEQARTGLIFYPGGLVEPAAYAPVMHHLAQADFFVVIAPMPFNIAIFGTGAAQNVIDAYPEINNWILAGHSLGGAAAAIYAHNNPDQIDALVFWDSYPPNSATLADVAMLRSYLDLGQGIPTGVLIQAMGGLYLGAILIGFALGLFYAANWALGTSLIPEDRAGEFFGLANLAGAGAGAVGAYIGGPIADQFSYTLIIGLYGIVILLSLLALLGIKHNNIP